MILFSLTLLLAEKKERRIVCLKKKSINIFDLSDINFIKLIKLIMFSLVLVGEVFENLNKK